MENYNTYNHAKLKILSAIRYFTQKDLPATSKTIAEYWGEPITNIRRLLNHYWRLKYIRKLPKKEGAAFRYRLNTKGRTTLYRIETRFNMGLELNLRKTPKKAEYYMGTTRRKPT